MRPLISGLIGIVSMVMNAWTLSAQRNIATRDAAAPDSRAAALLARPVSLTVTHAPLARAIDEIAASAKVLIQYQMETVSPYAAPVSVSFHNTPLRIALDRVLAGTTLRVVTDGATRLAIVENEIASRRIAVTGTLLGRVTDIATKQPLRGATVVLDDAARGVQTDEHGQFRFVGVGAGSHRVTVRLIGYVKQSHTVLVTDGETATVDIALGSSANTLDQVVVTGTVVATELKAVPNAITVITAKQIEERGITHIDQLFRGDVPGVFAFNIGSAASLDAVAMFSRGATALSGLSAGTNYNFTNPMKTYVDGVEMADPQWLSQIDPKSIERIEILTGPQASTIYGSNAINGVMQIFTKRGTGSTPQLTLNLQSGWVENNFSPALTPQHDYSAQLNGIEGHLSYNAGGAWNYTGAWAPAKQTARTNEFGGARIEFPTALGRTTADVTLQRTDAQNHEHGDQRQDVIHYRETGWFFPTGMDGRAPAKTSVLASQTLGLTVGYTPTGWWSHEFGVGDDVADTDERITERGYAFVEDTTLSLSQTRTDRRSMRYTTTLRVPMASIAQATMTLGTDAWQKVKTRLGASPQVLTGNLGGDVSLRRQPDHNTGAFVQTQVGVHDQLFFTYGLRAEWNPNFGDHAQPNYAPRYGVAYTQEMGTVTAKLRASYGRSTRPPARGLKTALRFSENGWGNFLLNDYGDPLNQLPNPALAPEHQQGGEGGLELYLGTRGSLVITRYNQVINGLIDYPYVDSVRSLTPNPSVGGEFGTSPDVDGYEYFYQRQALNLGSIRNQGWELQGSVNIGPFTTKGTYSWTKSRSLGLDSRYRWQFSARQYPQYQPGATFQWLPEHTLALGVTYALARTTMALNTTWTGQLVSYENSFTLEHLDAQIRLRNNRFNVAPAPDYSVNPSYALTDFNMTHRFSSAVDGVVQVQNLTDHYRVDISAGYATLGRQMKCGFRLRLQ